MGIIMALLVLSPISVAHSCLSVLRCSRKLESWTRLTAKITLVSWCIGDPRG